jgi:hypothetical protein
LGDNDEEEEEEELMKKKKSCWVNIELLGDFVWGFFS